MGRCHRGFGRRTMTNFPSSTFEAAQAYVASGLSVIPIDPNPTKRPAYRLLPTIGSWPDGRSRHGWTPFKERLPTPSELHQWFNSWVSLAGIAVVCGRVSGNLEVIDIDSAEYALPWLDRVNSYAPGLVERLVLVQTPRPGLHAYYRCPVVGGNEKLATIAVAGGIDGEVTAKTIIETRGEGGYALIPPTPHWCHPTGRTYTYYSHRTLADVQSITPEERSILFETARTFHSPPVRHHVAPPRPATPRRYDRRLPGDDFNHRSRWDELLGRHGWSLSHVTPEGIQHWTRPGKSEGTSATVDYSNNDLLHVFTSNASPLEPDTSYSKFGFLVSMEYEGDYEAAARALRLQGFGQPSLPAGRRDHRQGTRSRRPSRNHQTRRRRRS